MLGVSFEKNHVLILNKDYLVEKSGFSGFSSFSSMGGVLRLILGSNFLTPLYVLIATNFAVATCISKFAFYRRFSTFESPKKGQKKGQNGVFTL